MAGVGEGQPVIFLELGFVTIIQPVMSHFSQASLVTDDDALLAASLPGSQPSSLDHVFHAHRLVVDRGDHQGADISDAVLLLLAKDRGGADGGLLLDCPNLRPLRLAQRRNRFPPRQTGAQPFSNSLHGFEEISLLGSQLLLGHRRVGIVARHDGPEPLDRANQSSFLSGQGRIHFSLRQSRRNAISQLVGRRLAEDHIHNDFTANMIGKDLAFHPQRLAHRVFPAAEKAHAAHGQHLVALIDIIAAHGGIAVGQHALQLRQA